MPAKSSSSNVETKPVWLVRSTADGTLQDYLIENGIAAIGWEDLEDINTFKTKEAISKRLGQLLGNDSPGRIANYTGQLWALYHRIEPGDLIVLPLKGRNAIAVGRCKSPYRFCPDNPLAARHTREVDWFAPSIPRNHFKQDLLDSLGAFMTVCRIRRNNAESRIAAIADGKPDPGYEDTVSNRKTLQNIDPVEDPDEDDAPKDYADRLIDQIRDHIIENFKDHALVDLVEAVLNAQGYQTIISPPGPDGGVDLIAGHGPLGLGHPRVAIQVKSGGIVCDSKMIREFKTVMREHNADCGLYVCWSGFNRKVEKERRKNFLELRYWDSENLIAEILRYYDTFPDSLKDKLPLKRVWMLEREN